MLTSFCPHRTFADQCQLGLINGEEWGDQGLTEHTPPRVIDTLYEILVKKLGDYLEENAFTVTADKDTSHGRYVSSSYYCAVAVVSCRRTVYLTFQFSFQEATPHSS